MKKIDLLLVVSFILAAIGFVFNFYNFNGWIVVGLFVTGFILWLIYVIKIFKIIK